MRIPADILKKLHRVARLAIRLLTFRVTGPDAEKLTVTKNGETVTFHLDIGEIAGGDPVEFQAGATHIQWRVVGDPGWTDLIAIADISGEDGTNGTDGQDGVDGREIEMQLGGGFLRYRYVGEVDWINIATQAAITGPAGQDGVDGQDGAPGTDGQDGAPGTDGQDGAPGTDGQDGGLHWDFSTTTTKADPGAGTFRLNHADAISATEMYINQAPKGGTDLSEYITSWKYTVGTQDGTLILFDRATPQIFVFDVSGVIDESGYHTVDISYVEGPSSGAFPNGVDCEVMFVQRGDPGPAGESSVLDFTAVKTGAYTAAVGEMVLCDCSASSFTISAPSSPSDNDRYGVLLETEGASGSGYKVTVDADGENDLISEGESIVFQYSSSASAWLVVDSNYKSGALLLLRSSAVSTNSAGVPKLIEWDDNTEKGRSLSISSGVVTIRRAGRYQVDLVVKSRVAVSNAYYYFGDIEHNGTLVARSGFYNGNTGAIGATVSCLIDGAVGDTIEGLFTSHFSNRGLSDSESRMSVREARDSFV